MKIAHTVENGMGGMSAAARLEAYWERELGHDARLVFPEERGPWNREGVPVADFEFVKQCDVIVSHSTLGKNEQDLGIPFVLMCHGTPEHCYWSQRIAETGPYTALSNLAAHKNCAFIVTHWKRHIPFWSQIMPKERIRYVPPGVDLDAFTNEPADLSVFAGMEGKVNVLSAGRWRVPSCPFSMVNAFGLFAKNHFGARLHIAALTNFVGLSEIMDHMNSRGTLGIVGIHTSRLAEMYRACDFSITSHWDAGLTPREGLACGCQVVGSRGLDCTPYTADLFDLEACAEQMELAYADLKKDGRRVTAEKNRQRAVEHFDPKVAAEKMLALLTSIRPSDNARSWASSVELKVYGSEQEASEEIDRVKEVVKRRKAEEKAAKAQPAVGYRDVTNKATEEMQNACHQD